MKLAKTFLFPYLKRFWLMLLSVVFVGAFGVGILVGLRDAYLSLEANTWSLVEECGYPDFYLETVPEIATSYTKDIPVSYLEEKLDIKKLEYRASYNTTFEFNGNSYSCRVFSYDHKEGLLKHHLIDGKFTYSGLRMEYYFSNANHIGVGNDITIKMHNGETKTFKIESTFVSPESSIVKADPYSVSSSRDFAYLFLPKHIFNQYVKNPSDPFFNEILVDYIDGKEKTTTELFDRLLEIAKESGAEITEEQVKQLKENIAYMTTYEESEVIKQYKDTLRGVNMISLAVPIAFFLVVLVVTSLFLFQIVRQCRKDIGIMRALGENKRSITLIYVLLALLIAVISWAIGTGIGVGITAIANYAYGTATRLYPLPLDINFGLVAIALGAMVLVCVVTSLLASLSISKIKPVEAMKALPPQNNKTPYLVRTLFKHAPITLKISISQTLRNLRRYILSGICLLASGMMVFFALSMELSKRNIISQLFEARQNYDVQVYFDAHASDELESYFDGDDNIKAKTLIKYIPTEVTYNDTNEVILINAVKPNQDLLRVVSDYNDIMPIPESGIVLSLYHANLLKCGVGDIIQINDVDVEVKGISREFLYQVSYMNYEAINVSSERGSLLAQVKDVNAFFEKYKNTPNVTYISFSEVIKQENNDRLMAFSYSSYILNAISIILGFMIVFNMMQTNLKEQKRTFATIRTLGYQRRDISTSNLLMSLVQYIIAMALAIPLGMVLSKLLLKGISIPTQTFPFPKSALMYILSMVLVLAFLLISHFISMNSMKKWNLPEAVKERE